MSQFLNAVFVFFIPFIIGIISSIHCVSMCLPLSLFFGKNFTFFQMLIYHISKIAAYVLIGISAAFIGVFFRLFDVFQAFSILVGFLFIIIAFFKFNPQWNINFFSAYILKAASAEQNKNLKSMLWGFSNGLIPCGLSYSMALGAATSYSLFDTVIYMILFGIGTSIVILFSVYFSQKVNFIIPIFSNKFIYLFLGFFILFRSYLFYNHNFQHQNVNSFLGQYNYKCDFNSLNIYK